MKKYIIIAESGADLSREVIDKYDIRVVPMHIELGDVDYLDDGSVSSEKISTYYNNTGKVPKTGASNPYDYQHAYEDIAEKYPEATIIHLCYSAQTTASFQNSHIADGISGASNRIIHIDTKNVSTGQGFVVMKTAKLIESEPDITTDELVKQIETYISKTRFYFLPGNLDFLRAGGRVSNAQFLGASLLRLKPLIELKDGLLVSTKKYRGSMEKAVSLMVNDFLTDESIDKSIVYLAYAGDLDEEIKQCVDKTIAEHGVKESVWHRAGGVITSHSGPGGIGIAGIVT